MVRDSATEPSGVVIETTLGDFAIELYWSEAPKTCAKFVEFCKDSYYDGTQFHRIIKNFMIQGGDPSGTGKGGLEHTEVNYSDETTKLLKHTGAGIVAMAAKTGSQFYITLAPTPWLGQSWSFQYFITMSVLVDGLHTIFGRISAGMRIIERLGLVPVSDDDRPLHEVLFVRCYPYFGPCPSLENKQSRSLTNVR